MPAEIGAASGSLFAPSAPTSSSASSSTPAPAEDAIISIVSSDELASVDVHGSDKYYVPRKKDLLKKERERARRPDADADLRPSGGRRVKDVGAAKEELLDFSDDDEDEADTPGLSVRPPKSKASAVPPKSAEEHKESDSTTAAQTVIRITPPTARATPTVIEPSAPSDHNDEDDDVVEAAKPAKAKRAIEEISDEEDEDAKPRRPSSTAAASTGTGGVAPLINPVAQTFFLQRFALTCTGGLPLRSVAGKVPWAVHGLAMASWLMAPVLVAVGSAVAALGGLPVSVCAVVSGDVALVLHAALHVWSAVVQTRRGGREDVDGARWTAASTLTALFPTPSTPVSASPILRALTASAAYGAGVGLASAALPAVSPLSALSGPGYAVLLALCLLAVAASLYPLQHCAVVDPNLYRADEDPPSAYSRPLHLLLLLPPLILITYLPAITSPAPALALLVLLAAFPLLHALGVLPQWHPLGEWVVEQASVLLFSAPPASSLVRGMASVAASLAISVGLLLLAAHTSTSLTVLLAVAAAVPATVSWTVPGHRVAKAVAAGASTGLIAAGIALDAAGVDLLPSIASVQPGTAWWWDGPLLALLFLTITLTYLRQPYLLRVLRNPLYLRRSPRLPLLSSLLVPAFLTAYLTVRLSPADVGLDLSFPSFLLSALLLRQYLVVWRHPHSALLSLSLLVLVDRTASASWTALSWQLRVWVASVALMRWRVLWSRAVFMAALTWSSHSQPKLRTRHPTLFLALSIALLPYHVALLTASAVLAFPVYPLLGSTVFLPSYPRPARVFSALMPSKEQSMPQWYYQHLVDRVVESIDAVLASAGGPLEEGETKVVMLRSEPYTLVLTVTAATTTAYTASFKGLELQRTSCHTAEALHLDECIDRWRARLGRLNPHPLHTYQHAGDVRLSTYVPNIVSLVGVLDGRDNLGLVREAFYRQLVVGIREALVDGAAVVGWPKPVPDADLVEAKAALPRDLVKLLFPSLPLPPSSTSTAPLHPILRLLVNLYALVYVLPAPSSRPMSTAALYALYSGKLPLTLHSLAGSAAAGSKYPALIVTAFRSAVALVFHAFCDGELERVGGGAREYQEWAGGVVGRVGVGMAGDDVGKVMDGGGKAEWFAVEEKGDEGGLMAVTVRKEEVQFGVMTSEWAVWEGVWVGTLVELLYFGNDDDERYSIQANEWVMRNSVVQAGEAPFGYAAYSSGTMIISR